jgi:SHS2 domain-containing protein
MYEVFEHTADLGIRVRAGTVNELFVDAGRGLMAQLVNLDAVRPVTEKTITLKSDSLEYLLFDWLSELLYAFEESRLLLSDFKLLMTEINDELHLIATCRGEVADAARHELDHEVKAITYHGLFVRPCEDGWEAEVIVDI